MREITVLLGFMGVAIYILLAFNLQKLLKYEMGSLVHLILGIICTLWLPIPIVFALIKCDMGYLIIGSIFGTFSLVVEILVMLVQASHLSYSKLNFDDEAYQNKLDHWVLNGLIGSQIELFMGVLKCFWIIFVTGYFIHTNQWIIVMISLFFAIINSMYIPALICDNLNIDFKFKLSQIVMHLETVGWYSFIIILLMDLPN